MPKTAQIVEESKARAADSHSETAKKLTQKRRMHPNSLKNLKLWEPGKSGNPGGRPKNDVAKKIMQAIFENNEEAIYKAIGEQILKGNAYCLDVAAKRAYGNIANKIEMGGPDGGPMELSLKVTFVEPSGS